MRGNRVSVLHIRYRNEHMREKYRCSEREERWVGEREREGVFRHERTRVLKRTRIGRKDKRTKSQSHRQERKE